MIAPLKQLADDFLTQEERTSAVWQSVKVHLQRKLAQCRTDNDNPELTDVETAALRGRIDCLKFMLNLGKEPPPKVVPNARPGPRVDLGAKYG